MGSAERGRVRRRRLGPVEVHHNDAGPEREQDSFPEAEERTARLGILGGEADAEVMARGLQAEALERE
eukprot:14198053-Alexandrium_andersonii.AAC.1